MLHYPYEYPEWRRLRRQILARDGHRCTLCGKDVSGWRQMRVDHIKPVKTHPHLALTPSNLRTLCVKCDGIRHVEKMHPDIALKGFNERGEPNNPNNQWYTR